MKYAAIALLLCFMPVMAICQQYEKVWMFGESNTLDFSASAPAPGGIPNTGGNPPQWYFHRSGAVCNAAGNLQFWVKLQSQMSPNAASTPNVFDRYGDAMPNGNLMSNYASEGVPVFVPFERDTNRYYVFYIKNGGFFYSVVDMHLNGGKGDVVPGSKNTQLSGWNSVIDYKMTAIQGCRSVWLVCRSRTANEFLSYEITATGISTTPVVSNCGLLPVSWYVNGNNINYGYYGRGGVMKASPDGRKLVVASNASVMPEHPEKGGLEIFDFEPCSGKISNAVLLATGSYYGACFSPDNSKLYTTAIYERRLYQYDLSLPNIAAITASKTLILSNPTYNAYPESWLLGDAKRGLDGKIYLGNYNCDNVNTNAMHIIEYPNLAGIACSPVINGLSLGANAGCTGFNLPADIVSFPKADTVAGPVQFVNACGADSILLTADHAGSCHQWVDGLKAQERFIKQRGIYVCTYSGPDCRFNIDTFIVSFPIKPVQVGQSFSCPNEPGGKVMYNNQDTTNFLYSWYLNGTIFQQKVTSLGDTATRIDTGQHEITFTTTDGCILRDTYFVHALPVPIADFDMPMESCVDMPITIRNRATAPMVSWEIGSDTFKQKDVTYTFWKTGQQFIRQTVMNLEGCKSILEKGIEVRSFALQLESDEDIVMKNQSVTLRATAAEPFSILFWSPDSKFSDPQLHTQTIIIDTTTRIIVKAASELGCLDTASINIEVKPFVFVPSAFSPNGDGKNDRFRVVSSGAPVFVTYFYIYSRWGELVYAGQGPSAKDGWDGMYKGRPCDVGTYYYTIQIETPQGEIVKQNGDVTLVR